jgi:hypothetical protein
MLPFVAFNDRSSLYCLIKIEKYRFYSKNRLLVVLLHLKFFPNVKPIFILFQKHYYN